MASGSYSKTADLDYFVTGCPGFWNRLASLETWFVSSEWIRIEIKSISHITFAEVDAVAHLMDLRICHTSVNTPLDF